MHGTWRLLPWAEKLDEICRSWQGTRYVIGQCVKGEAVDCLHFVSSVLEEARGVKIQIAKPLRYTSRGEFLSTVRELLRAHHAVRRTTDVLETGDILLTERDSGLHVMVITTSPHTAWHAEYPSVHISSIAHQRRVLGVLRPLGKDQWKIAS